ncbi:MAG: hypothetical protein ABSE89_02260 [Sedimentisphaerales bacterium]
MSENEKKNECCCCKCWGRIFITIALLAIGAVIGHIMTVRHHCCHMRGLCGDGYGREARWDRGERECEGGFEHKFREEKEGRGEREEKGWFGHKDDMGKCKPGCTCPICSKKAASLSEPNKAGCPMMDKKAGKSDKD